MSSSVSLKLESGNVAGKIENSSEKDLQTSAKVEIAIERKIYIPKHLNHDWRQRSSTSASISSCTTESTTYTHYDLSPFNKKIASFAKKRDLRGAISTFESIPRGLKPDEYTFGGLINACIRAGKLDMAFDKFMLMFEHKVKPNLVIYNTLINAFAKSGDVEKAFKMLERMKVKDQIDPDTFTYTSLINACVRAGSVEKAFDVFKQMKDDNIQPNFMTYTTLIKGCAKIGDAEKAFEVFEQMKIDGVQPDVLTYETLIEACVKGGKVKEGLELFEQMKEEGFQPDDVTVDVLIDELVAEGCIETAKTLFVMRSDNAIYIEQKEGLDAFNCHDFSHGSAFTQLLIYLDKKRDFEPFIVVTGKGLHSKKNIAGEMRDYILNKFAEHNLPWEGTVVEENEGMLLFKAASQ